MQKFLYGLVKRKISVLMIFNAVILFGILCITSTKIDYLPPMEVPKLSVATSYPGLPPGQIRRLISIPLENALSSAKGLKKIQSVSREGLSLIELQYHWGTDMTVAGVDAREIIDTAFSDLPTDASKPVVIPAAAGEDPVIILSVIPKKTDIMTARQLASREIRSILQQMESAGQIILAGGLTKEVQVLLDPEKAFSRGITISAVSQILQANNVNSPGGSFVEGRTQYIVKTDSDYKSLEDIKTQKILLKDSPAFELKDIAEVRETSAKRMSWTAVNGEEAVFLYIFRRQDKSPLALSEEIRETIKDLRLSYGQFLDFEILDDSSKMISLALSDLCLSALMGTIIAFFILRLFLGLWKPALLITFSIPVSILLSGIFLKLAGISLNTMSLGGLALGIGMLVDNSVVMIDNLIQDKSGTDETIASSASGIFPSLAGSTLTSCIVFLPVIFLKGIVGRLFFDLALSVCFSLIASLIVSLFLIPVLFKLMKIRAAEDKEFAAEKKYKQVLEKLLKKKFFFIALILLCCLSSFLMLPFLKSEFMPAIESSRLDCSLQFPAGTDIEYSKTVIAGLCRQLKMHPQVKTVYARIGGEMSDPVYLSDPGQSSQSAQIHLVLEKGSKNSGIISFAEKIFTPLGKNPDWKIRRPQNILTPLLGIRSGEERILVTGNTPEEASVRAAWHLDKITQTTGNNVRLSPSDLRMEIKLTIDREAVSSAGQSAQGLTEALRQGLTGSTAISIFDDGIPVRIKIDEKLFQTEKELESFPVQVSNGALRELGTLARIEKTESVPLLLRMARKDVMTLIVDTGEKPLNASYMRSDKNLISESGSELSSSFSSIIIMLLLSLALLYLVLGAQFQSFLVPLLILASIPLCALGIFGLWFATGTSLNFSSMLGLLVLLGISVNNGILLFENYKSCEADNYALQGMITASAKRLRPILMTAMTTVTALVPVAINFSGTSSQAPLAITVIGGLTMSTLLALLFFPLVFSVYFSRLKKGKTQ